MSNRSKNIGLLFILPALAGAIGGLIMFAFMEAAILLVRQRLQEWNFFLVANLVTWIGVTVGIYTIEPVWRMWTSRDEHGGIWRMLAFESAELKHLISEEREKRRTKSHSQR